MSKSKSFEAHGGPAPKGIAIEEAIDELRAKVSDAGYQPPTDKDILVVYMDNGGNSYSVIASATVQETA